MHARKFNAISKESIDCYQLVNILEAEELSHCILFPYSFQMNMLPWQ